MLTHFQPMFPSFSFPENIRKTKVFWSFQGVVERENLAWNLLKQMKMTRKRDLFTFSEIPSKYFY